MRWPHLRLFGLLAVAAVQPLEAQVAVAATYPAGTLTFGTGQIALPAGPVAFSTGPIAFSTGPLASSAGPLSFPSGPLSTETATTIEITLPADVLFDFDKAEIRADAQVPLHELSQLLREKAHGAVTIQGYTDALGNDTYNQRLSERRAAAVRTWLATREGLASMKFTTSGLGARNPVAPNRNPDGSDNPEGRQLNRRVTIIIRK
jgi:outer membrane protein OmpA-like peptidoglycan-associated protein